ncbi:50S ribosomal protein L4 [Microlunatus speluncae]|uniref:50S ribosomal protein L4, sunset domain variant n=1 Tax=Microlunatus speluncae TaxID=2594267 RepID=UPI0012666615|nr:50S ribosomal protein L4 [Microlunatus speluncae]
MTDTVLETRSVDVLDASGAKSGTAELPAEIFDVTANIPLIHQVVTAQLAAARQGTHSTKGRGEVRGGGRKPYRQKGTGRARQGSIRAPQYTGGGVVHGPTPRNYSQRTPKKMIAAALRGALSDRARGGRVHVVSELVGGDTPSTKTAIATLAKVADAERTLVVLHRDDDLAWLSLRNVVTVHALAVDQLNAYDVLVNDVVVFTEAALKSFVGRSAGTVETEHAHPYGDGSYVGDEPPAGFDIKGNEDSKKFHTPQSSHYGRTEAEVWFNSVEAAEAAGFVATKGDAGAGEKSE